MVIEKPSLSVCRSRMLRRALSVARSELEYTIQRQSEKVRGRARRQRTPAKHEVEADIDERIGPDANLFADENAVLADFDAHTHR